MTADLDALIARLEAATAGSDELDALAIASVVEGAAVIQSPLNGRWCICVGEYRGAPRIWEPRDERHVALRRALVEGRGPTRSLDAALMLVPEGWFVVLMLFGKFFHAKAFYPESELIRAMNAPTPSLAVCIAALKARKHV